MACFILVGAIPCDWCQEDRRSPLSYSSNYELSGNIDSLILHGTIPWREPPVSKLKTMLMRINA